MPNCYARELFMKLAKTVIITSLALLTFGCRSTVATYDPATGRKTLHKVSGEWGLFTFSADWHIQQELHNAPPDAGIKTWKEFWEWRFSALRQYQKDPQKYIDYIKQRRLEVGLPDYHWSN